MEKIKLYGIFVKIKLLIFTHFIFKKSSIYRKNLKQFGDKIVIDLKN